MNEVTINYDDRPEDIIEKINHVLGRHSLKLFYDGQEHDGYCIYKLITAQQAAGWD